MQRLFGLPVAPLAVGLAVALGAALGAVALLAVRNRVFLKLGLRNMTRRRGRTAIIVAGLMLGTAIIASALGMGDTMASTIRSSVITSLGHTDEFVSLRSAQVTMTVDIGQSGDVGYFPEADAVRVVAAARRSPLVDGAAPAIIEPVAVQDETSRQNEPRVTLFAADPARLAGFGSMTRARDGARVSLADLRPGEAYLNERAGRDLGAQAGDRIAVFASGRQHALTVRDLVHYDGTGTDKVALLLPLAPAQQLLGQEGRVKHVLVSNAGGSVSGVRHTAAVRALLDPAVAPLGLESRPVKEDGLKAADQQGNAFMSMFTNFGMFTISAGILLIFLIFVMLAAERRSEMGVARAVGTQRRHLVEMFVFEGVAYDLVAAAVGAALGIAIAYAMVQALAGAFASTGLEVRHSLHLRSVVIAYALGVLLTFAVVTISAWRVSRLNVVSAIRNLPEPRSRHRRAGWQWGIPGLVAGGVVAAAGASAAQATPFLLGVSVVIVALVLLARAAGVNERLAFTLGGVALVAWWLLPFDVYSRLVPDLAMDFSVWVTGSLLVVVGTTWILIYNADLILAAIMAGFGRVRSLAPVLKTSVATPLRNRFRTGTTVALFTLVVFTLVVGSTTSGSFMHAMNDKDTFGGGFHVRAETSPLSPVGDLASALAATPGLRAGDFTGVASQSYIPVEARQAEAALPAAFAAYPLRGLDDPFLGHTTFGLAAIARGYSSDRQVWQAMAADPTLAVVDAKVAPRRSMFMFDVLPEFQLSGFFLEDEVFDPVALDVRDPQSGTVLHLRVIGVLKDTAPLTMAGITTSQRTLAPFGARATPTVHYFSLAAGVDPYDAARRLESAFLAEGMKAQAVDEIRDDAVGSGLTFQRLILGFLGLGLVIGVAALGVITARSVVERRQQIGVLRAIGFQRSMVKLSLLIETSFVTLVAIAAGTGLGLLMAWNIIADSARQPSWDNLRFIVPWPTLALVFTVVYLAAVLTTYLPARRAAAVYPAAALRYQ